MKLKFETTGCRCLRQPVREVRRQEQCQEVRLPEELPDIGRVVGAWGQVVLRSKEWFGNAMQAGAGVMARILYAPEDGSACRWTQAWIPVQLRWEFPEPEREGLMCMQPRLCQIDARTVSPRKLMVRVTVGMLGQVWEPVQLEISKAEKIPDQVELLQNTYPVTLVREAGEKVFTLQEELEPPKDCPGRQQVVYYTLQPCILEQKVLTGRLVFRGTAQVHLLYENDGGQLAGCDLEVPFSQLEELEESFSQEAKAEVIPVVTDLELENGEEGGLSLKVTLAAQYRITDRVQLEIPEDAYSPVKKVEPEYTSLDIPGLLDVTEQTVRLASSARPPEGEVIDAVFLPDFSREIREGDSLQLCLTGQQVLLTRMPDGELNCTAAEYRGELRLAMDEQIRTVSSLVSRPDPKQPQLQIRTEYFSGRGIEMLTALTVEEGVRPPVDRPVLVLRRFEEDSLWQIAKKCGSTVGAIRRANHLEAEPVSGQMLLIPVI